MSFIFSSFILLRIVRFLGLELVLWLELVFGQKKSFSFHDFVMEFVDKMTLGQFGSWKQVLTKYLGLKPFLFGSGTPRAVPRNIPLFPYRRKVKPGKVVLRPCGK